MFGCDHMIPFNWAVFKFSHRKLIKYINSQIFPNKVLYLNHIFYLISGGFEIIVRWKIKVFEGSDKMRMWTGYERVKNLKSISKFWYIECTIMQLFYIRELLIVQESIQLLFCYKCIGIYQSGENLRVFFLVL